MKIGLVSLACSAAALLSACALSGSDHAHRYYTLEPATAAAAEALRPEPRNGVLLIAPVAAAPFYAGRDIAFSTEDGVRGRYQFSSWTEPPAISVHGALESGLAHAGLFRSLATPGGGLKADWLLSVRLVEIYHDAQHPPGLARLTLTAELVNLKDRSVVARRTFATSAASPSHDAAGAVAALRDALGTAVGELVVWIDDTLPA